MCDSVCLLFFFFFFAVNNLLTSRRPLRTYKVRATGRNVRRMDREPSTERLHEGSYPARPACSATQAASAPPERPPNSPNGDDDP